MHAQIQIWTLLAADTVLGNILSIPLIQFPNLEECESGLLGGNLPRDTISICKAL